MIFIKPCEGRLTSGFRTKSRPNHHGIDLAQPGTVEIKAAASGKVSKSYYSESYGEVVFIVHNINGQTYETVYAHLRKGSRKVKVGETVKQGHLLGYMGNTGHSNGQHLHFEVHKGRWDIKKSLAIDPWPLIQEKKGVNKVEQKQTVDGTCRIDYKGKHLEGIIINGVSYAPVRKLAELQGLEVGWDQKTSTVTLK